MHPGAQRFIIDRKALSLLYLVCSNWLAACPVHSLTPASVVSLICEAIPELRCYYSCCRISGKLCGNDCPQSQEAVSLSVPEVQTELSREAFMFSVTSAQKSELNECEMNALLLAGKRILKGSSGSFIMNLIQSAFRDMIFNYIYFRQLWDNILKQGVRATRVLIKQ